MKLTNCLTNVLLYIYNNFKQSKPSVYPSFIANELGISVPYIYPLIKQLINKKLIKIISTGKIKQIIISKKGVKACEHLIKFLELFGND